MVLRDGEPVLAMKSVEDAGGTGIRLTVFTILVS